jgi:hypothetical protein
MRRLPLSIDNGKPGRGVPDIAMSPTNYFTRVHTSEGAPGGTSAVAPLMAALVARLNRAKKKNVGFLNPFLYSNATKGVVHDVTSGTNAIKNKIKGYQAGPGWNACTGLGTPDGTAILKLLAAEDDPRAAAPEVFPENRAAPESAIASSSMADSLVPATERQIDIWIGEKETGLKRVLKIGHTDVLSFRIGQPVAESLTSGAAAAVSSSDVPAGGLPTDWLVVARGAELAVGTPDTKVSVATVGGVSIWSGRFKIQIPKKGDSATPQLKIKPLQGDPKIDVVITARKKEAFPFFNEVYRQFKIVLAVADSPGMAPAAPVRIADEQMPTATAHIGLSTTHEWTTPNGLLSVIVFGSQAAVQGVAGLEQVDSLEPWVGVPAQSGKIKNVRDAAEEMRAAWESHLNDIDPIDLAARLKRWNKGGGGPEYDWGSLGNCAV